MAQNEQKGLSGKILQLQLMGLNEEQTSRINDVESADALIAYMQQKEKAKSIPAATTKEPQPQIKTNAIPLPSTEPNNKRENREGGSFDDEDEVSYAELHDPRQPNVARLNLMDQEMGRILLLENDDMSEGGIF